MWNGSRDTCTPFGTVGPEKTGVHPEIANITELNEMRRLLDRSMDESLVPRQIPSVLWTLEITHAEISFTAPDRSPIVTDKFYTPHVLGRQLKQLSDNEVLCLGWVKMNNFYGVKIPAVNGGIDEFKEAPHGCCRLFIAYKKPIVTKAVRRRSEKLSKREQTTTLV